MEKKLEIMKKEITNKNTIYMSLITMASAVLVLNNSGAISKHYANLAHADFIEGFILGLIASIDLVCVFQLLKNMAALKDEKQLMRLYNEMNDERNKQIQAIAGANAVKMSMVLLIAAALVVSFFSFEAFIALVVAVLAIGILYKGLVFHYKRTEI